jgi:hypothetical protein
MIMCQGETDFIYTVNPATGLVHVAKTPTRTEWSQSEYTVAGVARPPLLDEQNSHWEETDVTSELFRHVSSNNSRAVFEPRASNFAGSVANDDSFKRIIQMSVWSVADASASLPCEDLAENLNVEAAKTELRVLTGIGDLKDCSDVPVDKCSDLNMYQLRALCPKTCECDATHLSTGSGRAGFFAAPEFGCPTQCSTFRAAENEIKFRFNMASEYYWMYQLCTDTKPADFSFPGNCSSSNRNSQGTVTSDLYLWDCDQYERSLDIEPDGDFCDSSLIVRDDVDFTASDMCCVCGGGQYNVKSSADCWDEWDQDCADMPREKLAWLRYVHGLFQYLYSRPGFEDGVRNVIREDYVGIDASEQEQDVIVHTITLGWFFRMLATTSNWEIAPGVPHPRGLTGCNFLASYEITALLNIDLCNPDEGTSIKFFCPSACQCTEASLLSECPAQCVLTGCDFDCRHVHPWYSAADFIYDPDTDPEPDPDADATVCEDTVSENSINKCPAYLDASNMTDVCIYGSLNDAEFNACTQCCICSYASGFCFSGGSSLVICHDTDGDQYATDAADRATDANGDGCQELDFQQDRNCSADDDDFTASAMCCVCSGGSDIGGAEFTILIVGMDLDSLSMAQRSNMTSTLKDLVLQAVIGTGRSPSSTIDNVQMELHNGSQMVQIIVPTRISIPSILTSILHLLASELYEVISGLNFTSSVVDAICLIDGFENYTSQDLAVRLYGRITTGGVVEGSPLIVPVITNDSCAICDCTHALDAWNHGCPWYTLQGTGPAGDEAYIASLSHLCHDADRNDDDFTAADMCCACEGIPHTDQLFPCIQTDNGAKDAYETGCGMLIPYGEMAGDAWSWIYTPEYDCDRNADDTDFTASDMCCECGGGEATPASNPIWDPCSNDDNGEEAKDSRGDKCRQWTAWEAQSEGFSDVYCQASANGAGTYDDADFTMHEMCCVCGGGIRPASRRS